MTPDDYTRKLEEALFELFKRADKAEARAKRLERVLVSARYAWPGRTGGRLRRSLEKLQRADVRPRGRPSRVTAGAKAGSHEFGRVTGLPVRPTIFHPFRLSVEQCFLLNDFFDPVLVHGVPLAVREFERYLPLVRPARANHPWHCAQSPSLNFFVLVGRSFSVAVMANLVTSAATAFFFGMH